MCASALLPSTSLRTIVHLLAFHPRLDDYAITIKDHEIRSTPGLNHTSNPKVSEPILGESLSFYTPTKGNSLSGTFLPSRVPHQSCNILSHTADCFWKAAPAPRL